MIAAQSQTLTLDKQLAQIAQFRAFEGMMKEEGKKMQENREIENFREWVGIPFIPFPGPEKTIEMPRAEMALREEIERLSKENAMLRRNADQVCALVDALRAQVAEQNRELAQLHQQKNPWCIPIPMH